MRRRCFVVVSFVRSSSFASFRSALRGGVRGGRATEATPRARQASSAVALSMSPRSKSGPAAWRSASVEK